MPTLHMQYNAQSPEGQPLPVAPTMVLAQAGPCLQVSVGLLRTMAQAMIEQGQAVPAPISGVGLVDTGASMTCIDEQVAQQLGLPVIDVITMASASHASIARNVYPVTIEIVLISGTINAPRAIGAELTPHGIVALIGRDVLRFCTLFYNGPVGQITLSV